jgi:hypothetical protein
MAILIRSFAGQNWLVTPAALAVGEQAPNSLSDQDWVFELTGVALVDMVGTNVHDWHRETLTISADSLLNGPMAFALGRWSIPIPPEVEGEFFTGLRLEQWVPFSAISSILDVDTGGVDAGFAVDAWRPTPFAVTTDVRGAPIDRVFSGIDVDVAVRNNRAILHRVSYHVTMIGKIVFLAGPL